MTEIVVVEHPNRSIENVSKGRHLERLHLREGSKESEFVVPNVELEESTAADDLQAWKLDVLGVDMTD